MSAPLSREDLRRTLLNQIRKKQRVAIGPLALVLSEADVLLGDRKPATLDYLHERYVCLCNQLGNASALRVLGAEFVTDVTEALEAGKSLQWVWIDREAQRRSSRVAYLALKGHGA